jgi:type IV pilus assembly protein PilB
MATATTDFHFSGLAKCLIQEGLITEKDAKTYIQEAQKNKVSLISYLVANKRKSID